MRNAKRILVVLLTLALLVPMFVFQSTAEEGEIKVNPFKDVKEDSYYYDAVLWAVDENITSGISADKFGPDNNCTRGQIVTFLWRAAGCPESTAENKFTDVKKGDYFYEAVVWAVGKGITTGTSDTKFSPNAPCTRAQCVTFLYRFADSPEVNAQDNPFKDVKSTDYFYNPVLWAVENEITKGMSSTSFGSSLKCSRGQIVTFLYRYSMNAYPDSGAPVGALVIEGQLVDDSWIIAYDEAPGTAMNNAVSEFKKYMLEGVGVELEVVAGAPAEGAKYFYLKNERVLDNYEAYGYESSGDGVVIRGDAQRGIIYGVYNFLEDEIGWRFVAQDRVYNEEHQLVEVMDEACNKARVLKLEDVSVSYEPYFEYRDLYISESYGTEFSVKRMINGDGKRSLSAEWGGQDFAAGCHTIQYLSEYKQPGYSSGEPDNPCLNDEGIYQTTLKNLKLEMASNPTGIISVSQNDTERHCTCSECMADYYYYGSWGGSWVEFCNRLCADTKDEYPNARIHTFAYQYTRKAPVNIVCDERLVVEFCPIDACFNHSFGDPECAANRQLKEDMEGWGKICSQIYVWDYGIDFQDYLIPFPNIDVINDNLKFMNENSVVGYKVQCLGGSRLGSQSPEFSALRVYLYCKSLENPYMTEEEYRQCEEDFCRIYYGAGYEYMLKYFDFLTELSDGGADHHWGVSYFVEGIYGAHPFTPYNDQLVEWFDKAEEMAETEQQLAHVQRTRIGCDYVRLGSIFLEYYQKQSGLSDAENTARRNYIINANQALFDSLIKFNVYELRDSVKTPASINNKSNVRKWITINGYKETNSPLKPDGVNP